MQHFLDIHGFPALGVYPQNSHILVYLCVLFGSCRWCIFLFFAASTAHLRNCRIRFGSYIQRCPWELTMQHFLDIHGFRALGVYPQNSHILVYLCVLTGSSKLCIFLSLAATHDTRYTPESAYFRIFSVVHGSSGCSIFPDIHGFPALGVYPQNSHILVYLRVLIGISELCIFLFFAASAAHSRHSRIRIFSYIQRCA